MDINADLGEAIPNERLLMNFITSCSVACGGHCGDETTVQNTVDLAIGAGLKIGAHPSYPDRANFGRTSMHLSDSVLLVSLRDQVGLLANYLKANQIPLHHIKPHGALYNDACTDERVAGIVVKLIKDFFPTSRLFAPPGSKLAVLATAEEIDVWYEGFADRKYSPNLSLVPRSHPGAVLESTDEVVQQAEQMIRHSKVLTSDGTWHALLVDTLCLHGDHPMALEAAKVISESLPIWTR